VLCPCLELSDEPILHRDRLLDLPESAPIAPALPACEGGAACFTGHPGTKGGRGAGAAELSAASVAGSSEQLSEAPFDRGPAEQTVPSGVLVEPRMTESWIDALRLTFAVLRGEHVEPPSLWSLSCSMVRRRPSFETCVNRSVLLEASDDWLEASARRRSRSLLRPCFSAGWQPVNGP